MPVTVQRGTGYSFLSTCATRTSSIDPACPAGEGGSVTRVNVFAGVCGCSTVIQAEKNENRRVVLAIESDCEAVRELGAALCDVDPFCEITFRGEGPLTLRLAQHILPHAACPVPAGIIKAVEVAGGLALPADATIRVSIDDPEK